MRSAGSKVLITDQKKFGFAEGRSAGCYFFIKRAGDIIQTGEPALLTIEPVTPGSSILIIGTGHVGWAVAAVAALTGFQVQSADDRCPEVTVEHICCAKEDFLPD